MARSHGAPLQQAQPAPHKARPAPKDAITLCKADLEAVSQLFAEYGKTRSVPNKKALVAEICTALSVHMQIEEDIFYPALMDVLKPSCCCLKPRSNSVHAWSRARMNCWPRQLESNGKRHERNHPSRQQVRCPLVHP